MLTTVFTNFPEDYMLPCLNKQLFGVDCLGCGMQRAIILVFQGEFVTAFKMYPAIYSILLLVLFLITNLFINFKYAYKIKIGMIFFTATIIVVSYFYKLIN